MSKLFAAWAVLALAGRAQEEKSVDPWVEDLQADDVEVRAAATQALKKMGKEAVARLERVLEKTSNPEVKGRITEILGSLKVPAEGGPPVMGLKIHLTCDRKEVRPGQELRFKAALWNVTNAPMNLCVGYSTGGVYFESGSAFDVWGAPQKDVSKPRWMVGFCGTGAGPLVAAIPAYGSLTYETVAVLQVTEKGSRYVFGKNQYLSFAAPTGPLHRFRVNHSAEAESGISLGIARTVGSVPVDAGTPSWSGAVVSNELEVKVLDPAK